MFPILKRFYCLLGSHKPTYLCAALSLLLATSFQLTVPWLIRGAIDTLETGIATRRNLIMTALAIVALTALEALFTFFKGRLSASASEGTVRDLRNAVFGRLMHIPMGVHATLQTGDVIQRATSDIGTIGRFLGLQVAEVARTLCLLIGVSVLLAALNPGLALYALAVVPPIFIFSAFFFSKIHSRFEQYDEAEAALSSRVQEHLSGIRVVKAFARETYELGLFDTANENLAGQDTHLIRLHSIFWPTSDLMCMMQAVIVLLIGGVKTISGDMTLGAFVAFNSYVMYLIWPVRHVGRLLGEMGRATVSIGRVQELLDLPVEEDAAGDVDGNASGGSIEFEDVSLVFGSNEVLSNVSLAIEPGQTLAILGATGSGKTTLVSLLGLFHDHYSGSIRIDGIELRDMSRQALRRRVGFVMQEASLFSRSIRDNIAFGPGEHSESDIRRAARTASADRFIGTFPDGYETLVGERGITLSGGQKQRLSLARTLVNDPPILVLDDTTSALDTQTESEICSAVRKGAAGRTTIIVTHRLSTAAGADRIAIMERGRLVQIGTHEELVDRDGAYRNLLNIQNTRMNRLRMEIENASNEIQRSRIQQAV